MAGVVWLASWYPNRYDELTGDFIQRHAQACSLYTPVHVIHVKKSSDSNTQSTNNTSATYPNLTETIIYYKFINLGGIERIFSYLYSLWLYYRQVKSHIRQHGKPSYLHVHVMLRCGLVALYYKWLFSIPFIVTEHNSAYMPGAEKYAKGITWLNYLPLKLITAQANTVTCVSNALAQEIQKKFRVRQMVVIPNVVNTVVFNPPTNALGLPACTFLHISALTPQKNPGQMLQAFAQLKHHYHCPFNVWIVGPEAPALKQMAIALNLQDNITWLPETTQQTLAGYMQQASALVLYSRYETFGCVNIEAMACGLPVIASDIPVFREYLQQGITAWFAQPDNPGALAAILYEFATHQPNINKKNIAEKAHAFSYAVIGKKIAGLYGYQGI
jgi:glycosyltransferase involved in cell wall biosynthesis